MEFSEDQIKEIANDPKIYEEGLAYYKSGCVVSIDIDDFSQKEDILVNSTLKIDKKYYEVNIAIDRDDYVVRAHLCNCVKNSPIAVCSHMIAVLFKMQDQNERKQVQKVETLRIHDPYVDSLIHQYEHENIYSALALSLNEKIQLEPVIEIKTNKVASVTLKVGKEKKYIIRDFYKFFQDIEESANVRYGKDLCFVHNLNSFDASAKLLIQFLSSHLHDNLYYSENNQVQFVLDRRSLSLTPSSLDQFFSYYIDQDVMFRYQERMLTNVKFMDKNPDFFLTCRMDEEGNYHFECNEYHFKILQGNQHIYILWNRYLYRCDEAYTKACGRILEAFQLKGAPLDLSKEQMPAFYNNVLFNIQDYMNLIGEDISEFAPSPLVCRLYLDMPNLQTLTARLLYNYGNMEFNAFEDIHHPARDVKTEIMVRLLLMRYMSHSDPQQGCAVLENSQDLMFEFFHHGLEELGKYCEIYGSDTFKTMQVKERVSISMGVRLKSNLLEINFDTYDFPIEELENVLKAYRLNKKYYRMRNGSFVNIEDSALKELSQIMDGMKVSDQQLSKGVLEVPKYRSLYLDNSMKASNMMKIERDHGFKDIIKSIKNIQDSDYEVPLNQKDILRNYQKTGFRWLKTMAVYGFGGILADDMGIGKTLQVITLLEDQKQVQPGTISLVICPSSLILNWESEIKKFSSDLTSIIINGHSEERIKQIKKIKKYDVVITSYDYLKRDIEAYEGFEFTYQFIDEAQYIKNHNTKNAQSVKQIKSEHRFALTGTPIENSLAELWSIFDYLMPGYLFNYAYFKKEYEVAIVRDHDMQALAALKRLVEPFILRRVKKDVLKELPEKVERTLLVDLNDETRKLYNANVALIKKDLTSISKQKFKSSHIMILSMLTKLRQLCCDPRLIYDNYQDGSAKLDACMELIQTCLEAHKKILIFSQFTSLLSLLEKELEKQSIPYYLLKGSTPKMQRQHLVNSFNNNQIPVFLISLKAGGTGLNLTGAEVVIHFDPWWNISTQNQATDRAYRIGQHNNVQVFKLISKDTIEERIMELQSKKQSLSDSIINNNEGIINQMSLNEILALF
ncbi:MAG: SNF2 helicase associated domain-containing protein [Erysipelotrichaceae bacterium]